jgi:hypothetical protein
LHAIHLYRFKIFSKWGFCSILHFLNDIVFFYSSLAFLHSSIIEGAMMHSYPYSVHIYSICW